MATKPKGLTGFKREDKDVRFSSEVRDALAYFAGLDSGANARAAAMLNHLEVFLPVLAEARHEDIHGPGPAAERKMLNDVAEAARDLERALSALSPRLWYGFRYSVPKEGAWSLYRRQDDSTLSQARTHALGPDLSDLVFLRGIAEELRAERKSRRSTGRRPEHARDEAIKWLVHAFIHHADLSFARTEKAFQTFLLAFVEQALEASDLPSPGADKLWQKIQTALKDWLQPSIDDKTRLTATKTSPRTPSKGRGTRRRKSLSPDR